MKSLLLGALLVSPGIVVWAHRGGGHGEGVEMIHQVSHSPSLVPSLPSVPSMATDLRVPIEILEKGKAPRLIYVEPPAVEAVPEPGMVSLLTVASLIVLLRRRRD